MMPLYLIRRIINAIALSFFTFAICFVLFWLLWILSTLFYEGLKGFNFSIFSQMTSPPNEIGGLANAIWGSLLMTTMAILIATPIGIFAGTYLAEFSPDSRFSAVIRFVNDVLLSAPSIVIGLFIYEIYVQHIGHFSGWAGIFALTIIAIPLILRTTDDMLRLVPMHLREAAAALGAPRWKIIIVILFRVVRRGIITGVLLALARLSGETAPLLFTALNNQFWSSDLSQPIANLPNTIFQYAMSPYIDWQQLAWNGSLIITVWVLFCNIFVRVFFKSRIPGR